MKYNTAKLIDEKGLRIINIENISEEKAKELEGNLYCPGEDCMARLYLVHNPADGGQSVFFKATNEDHNPNCIYKNENFKGDRAAGTVLRNGYYTELQINDYVRNLYKDVTTPPNEKKKNASNGPRKRRESSGEDQEKGIIRGGRVVSGNEEVAEGNKGRMSRRYEVSENDIGMQIGVYGNIKSLILDQYGQIHIMFKEDRYSNIEVLIGQVYRNFNEFEYSKIDSVQRYYNKLVENNSNAFMVAGGLVTKYNGQLTIELQARYSFRINGFSILDMIRGEVDGQTM